jgi:hypothetical protein
MPLSSLIGEQKISEASGEKHIKFSKKNDQKIY